MNDHSDVDVAKVDGTTSTRTGSTGSAGLINSSSSSNNNINEDAYLAVMSSIEYKDDLIWILPATLSSTELDAVVSRSSSHEYVVPLLPSTVRLLQEQLREPISVPYITSIDDTTKNDGVQRIANDVSALLNITATTTTTSSLTRVTGLADDIIQTLNDFRTIRRNNATKIGISHQLEQKQNHQGYRRRRNRRNHHGVAGDVIHTTTGNAISSTTVDLNKDGDNDVDPNNDDDDDDNSNNAEEEEEDDGIDPDAIQKRVTTTATCAAWYMLIATLNSLRILTPIVFRLLWHPQRNDKELLLLPSSVPTANASATTDTTTIRVHIDDEVDDDDEDDYDDYEDRKSTAMNHSSSNGNNRNGRRSRERNAKCWLIGTHVYGQCNVRQCKLIWKNMEHLYDLLGVVLPSTASPSTMTPSEQAQTLLSYMSIITTNMKQLVSGYSSSSATKSTPTQGSSNNLEHCNAKDNAIGHAIIDSVQSNSAWLNYHPFDEMDEYDQTKVYMSTQILDQRFQLQLNTDALHPKDKIEKNAYLKAIYDLHEQLKGILSNKYPGSRISMYGSCLSDLSLGKNADVDFSLYIEELADTKNDYEMKKINEDTYRSVTKKYVYATCRLLERQRKQLFQKMTPVAHARVPVVKGTYIKAGNPHSPDGSLDFDICFINDIAVSNSELIRQYSLVSDTVKSFMLLVKRWAKANHLASTQDNSISSYAWMNLAIYYMQCIGIVPNLQCPKLMKLVNRTTNKDGAYWDNVNFLNTRYITWEQASTAWTAPTDRVRNMSITALLYGFFDFYVKTFPSTLYMVSIATGATVHAKPKTLFDKTSLFWCIEDPFELAESYCPHDLGMHASEPGAALILERMRAAEAYLRTQLLQVLDMDSDETTSFLSNIQSLWPPVKLASSGKEEPKTNNRGNAPRRDPIRTTGNVEDMNIEAKPDVWPTLATPATTKKPAASSNVKVGPAIASIQPKTNNTTKPMNGATKAKPNHSRNGNNGANVKAGSRPTAPSTATNQKPSARNANPNSNSHTTGKSADSKPQGNHPSRRRPQQPPKKVTTTAVGVATTSTATTTTKTTLPPKRVPQQHITK